MEERTQFLDIDISIERLSRENQKQLLSFSCGCEVLDKFFYEEILLCDRNHYLSAYCVRSCDEIVAIFTLSNDSVIIDDKNEKDDFIQDTKLAINDKYCSIFEKQTSYPAVNIGHLGVRTDLQGKGIGKKVIDFVLYTFSEFNISGCQFITVDSLNNPRTNKFYSRENFRNQTNSDYYNDTRRMYLPIQFNSDE